MRHRARSLHVLAIAPVAAIFAGVLGPTPHALAAPTRAPSPIVITVDPAFGGRPTPAHPGIRFDPGAIGVNGILEKDVDLDVGTRLARLLRADLVQVVMTRTGDVFVTTARRRQISNAHRSTLVVSVAAGSTADHRVSGSLVAYGTTSSQTFARTLSDALGAQLSTDGVPDRGAAFSLDAWQRSPVPAATVEMAYLSNPGDAALLASPAFRQDVASGIRNGLEAYLPAIIARRDAILAWRHGHAGSVSPSLTPASASIPQGGGFQFGPLFGWLLAIVAAGAVLLWREQVARVLVLLGALVVRAFGSVLWLRRAAIRRSRRRQRRRTEPPGAPPSSSVAAQSWRHSSSVYDDIPL